MSREGFEAAAFKISVVRGAKVFRYGVMIDCREVTLIAESHYTPILYSP